MAGVLRKLKSFFTLGGSSQDNYHESESLSRAWKARPAEKSIVQPAVPRMTNVIQLNNRKQEVLIVEPTSFGEAREVAEALKQKKSIIINLRRTEKDLARRIVDFLGGISYATEGHMQKVADFIYVFTPPHIHIGTASRKEYDREEDPLFKGAVNQG